MTPAAPAPRRSWLPLALVASLAVNLFLIGLIGGQVLSGSDKADGDARRPGASRGYSLNPQTMMEALPESRHGDIRAFWAEARQGMGRDWRGINAIRRDIDAALRAESFDLEALNAAQQREVAARSAMRTKLNESYAAFLATMTEGERAMVADVAMARMKEQSAYWRERARKRREAEAQ